MIVPGLDARGFGTLRRSSHFPAGPVNAFPFSAFTFLVAIPDPVGQALEVATSAWSAIGQMRDVGDASSIASDGASKVDIADAMEVFLEARFDGTAEMGRTQRRRSRSGFRQARLPK